MLKKENGDFSEEKIVRLAGLEPAI